MILRSRAAHRLALYAALDRESLFVTPVAGDDGRTAHRILLVEPDDETRALYSQSLQRVGYEVIEASDGRDALVKALTHTPTLVITEAQLPMFDGYALCEVLRRDSTTQSVPILFVTTETRAADIERARLAGATAVLAKPAPRDVVLGEIRRLLTPPGERQGTSTTRRTTAAKRSQVLARPGQRRRTILAKTRVTGETTTPPAQFPQLRCPSCDRLLEYRRSHLGGVSSRHPEQWDDFVCPSPSSCGMFQYRHRTRKLRLVN